ncbi:hypothetical protein [Rhizobium wenxiniae]|uniref:hypothetical protein n=1 Tax=Rhizobium wenxiniae TaxID=1737357 RepID=UPI003C2157FC
MQTHQFITELIRAANSVEKVGLFEQRRLLERAVTIIYELREAVGIPRSAKGSDAVTNLKILATKVDAIPLAPKEVSDGLLEAAGMIRDLHIVRENGMQFSFGARP